MGFVCVVAAIYTDSILSVCTCEDHVPVSAKYISIHATVAFHRSGSCKLAYWCLTKIWSE